MDYQKAIAAMSIEDESGSAYPSEWEGRVQNLMKRFPESNKTLVVKALQQTGGHAGQATSLLQKETKERDSKAETVAAVFRRWDQDGNGTIDQSEFTRFLVKLGMTEDEAKLMFESADANKNGVVEYEEFVDWIFQKAPDHVQKEESKAPDNIETFSGKASVAQPQEESKVPSVPCMDVEVVDLAGNVRKFNLPARTLISQLIVHLNLSDGNTGQLIFEGKILDGQRTLEESLRNGATVNLHVQDNPLAKTGLCGVWEKTSGENTPYERSNTSSRYKLSANGVASWSYHDSYGDSMMYESTSEDASGTWSYANGKISITCSGVRKERREHEYMGDRSSESKIEHKKEMNEKDFHANFKKTSEL